MSDLMSLKSTAKHVLCDIAKHANALAMGLQNAAPPGSEKVPNKSIQYLVEIAHQLEEASRSLDN